MHGCSDKNSKRAITGLVRGAASYHHDNLTRLGRRRIGVGWTYQLVIGIIAVSALVAAVGEQDLKQHEHLRHRHIYRIAR